jgi:hypothetical protein
MAVAEFGSNNRVFLMGEIGTDENFGDLVIDTKIYTTVLYLITIKLK